MPPLPGVNGGYQCNGMNLETASVVSPHSPVIETGNDIPRRPDSNHHHQRVSAAIRQLGYLLQQQGVRSRSYLEPGGQGVDDLIAAHGQGVFEQAYQTAATLDTWKAKSLTRLTHPPQICG